MKIKFNQDLLIWKKDQVVEYERLHFKHRVYVDRRIEDARIDGCVEVLSDDEVAEDRVQAPSNLDKPSKSKRKTGE